MIDRGDKGVELPQEVGRWLSSVPTGSCLSFVPTDFLTFSILLPWVYQTLQILIVWKPDGPRSLSDLWCPRGICRSCWNPPVTQWGNRVG